MRREVAADVVAVAVSLEGAVVKRAFPEDAVEVEVEVVSAEVGLPRAGAFHPRLQAGRKPPGEAGRE